jgi:hypothetical protein
MTNAITCAYIGCTEPTTYERPLCNPHWQAFDRLEIGECDNCHRFHETVEEHYDEEFGDRDLCWDCAAGRSVPFHVHMDIEHQERYLYIMKLDGGKYYIGQTTDLEARLGEHKAGLTPSSVGKSPKLVYFQKWIFGKKELKEYESDLILENKSNPRTIRKMVLKWQRLIRLVHIEEWW